MEKKESIFSKLKLSSFFSNKKTIIALVAIIICAATLVMISGTQTKKSSNSSNVSSAAISVSSYSKTVAQELENIINNISGVSNAKVLVVVESSPVKKFLTSSDEVILSKTGSTSSPVELCEMYPKITGVLVVAKGVTNLKVKNDILGGISAVYGLEVSKIDILEGK